MIKLQEKNQTKTESRVLEAMGMNNHEQVVFCNDPQSGLRAIIAIHNTFLGPALGGTRMWHYNSEAEALNDVLRLSRGMTYKAAISGLNLGGGKAVIIGNSQNGKSEAIFRRFGKFVDSLNGKYITAEDVGTSTRDMEYVAMETDHVTGLPESMGGGGDPSPVTAYGTFVGMKACVNFLYGNDSLAGKKVVVQGVGHVGENLVKLLLKENAKVMVSDVNENVLAKVAEENNIEVIPAEIVYDIDCDIYAPCALGATLNSETLSRLKCAIIAGAANNQLADENLHGGMLLSQGITYAPDFLINAGGLINVCSELTGYNREQAYLAAEKIYYVTLDILKKSKEENIPTHIAAMELAEKRIAEVSKIKLGF